MRKETTMKRILAPILALLTVATLGTVTAQSQWNPSTTPLPTLTLYVGQTDTLTLEGYNPSGYTPFLLDSPYFGLSTLFEGYTGTWDHSVAGVQHSNNAIMVTAIAPGTVNIGAEYQVSDPFGDQTDLVAGFTLIVKATPTYESINGDSLLYFVPSVPLGN